MSEIFIISLCCLCSIFFLYLIKLCTNSKCDNVDCLCFKIHRNVKLERDIEKYKIENKIDDLEGLNQNINNVINNVRNNNIIK
jgi:hypothetical protein